jgi:ketosteroid isomerase-like protein
MSRSILALCLVVVALAGFSQSDTALVRSRMLEQEQAWNRGDLRGFMQPYWNDEKLMFIGSKGITYGWKSTLANYERSYPTKEKMGELKFNILHLELLSPDQIYVIGRWQLKRDQPVGGHFSLLWRKINGSWVIVSDHTS